MREAGGPADRSACHDDLELLKIDASVVFALTPAGRILHENDPVRSIGPRLFIARSRRGALVRARHDVGDETARRLEALAAEEPPLTDYESDPVRIEEYIRILSEEAPVERRTEGVIYHFPDGFGYGNRGTVARSQTREGDRILGQIAREGMPQPLLELGFRDADDFWPPWAVALHEGEIASVAITARLGQAGASVGIVTVPALRGRGFAAAAVSAWASSPSLNGLVRFYSANRDNRSSRRVAARLGLRLIGASLRLY